MSERAFLDRVEGERAVLLFGPEGAETGVLPARLLPPGCREGDALLVTLAPEPESRTRDEVRALMRELLGESAEPEGGEAAA